MTLLFLPCSGTSLKNVIRIPEKTHQIRSCHHQKWKRTKTFKFSEIVERIFRCALTSSHSSVNSLKSSVRAEPLWFAEVSANAWPYCLATACLRRCFLTFGACVEKLKQLPLWSLTSVSWCPMVMADAFGMLHETSRRKRCNQSKE